MFEQASNFTYPAAGTTTQDMPLWYLIHTKPHAEELVQHNLKQHRINNYLPKLLTRRVGRRTLTEAPLFPGYIFFQLESTSRYWAYLRWMPGVAYLLTDELGPVSLPPDLVTEIAEREARKRHETVEKLTRPFDLNEPLQLISGPLAGLDAVFDRPLSSAGRVQVLINLLGRQTRVTVEASALRRS